MPQAKDSSRSATRSAAHWQAHHRCAGRRVCRQARATLRPPRLSAGARRHSSAGIRKEPRGSNSGSSMVFIERLDSTAIAELVRARVSAVLAPLARKQPDTQMRAQSYKAVTMSPPQPPCSTDLTCCCLSFTRAPRHNSVMLLFWRIFNRAILLGLTCLVSVDAYAWIGPGVPDRFLSSILFGGMAGLLWAIFGSGVHRLLE